MGVGWEGREGVGVVWGGGRKEGRGGGDGQVRFA